MSAGEPSSCCEGRLGHGKNPIGNEGLRPASGSRKLADGDALKGALEDRQQHFLRVLILSHSFGAEVREKDG